MSWGWIELESQSSALLSTLATRLAKALRKPTRLLVSENSAFALAQKLLATNAADLDRAAQIIADGGVIAMGFNGVFGLFGDADRPEAAGRISRIKQRPPDQTLITVALPEAAHEVIEIHELAFPHERLLAVWREIHALGAILPASSNAPAHLTVRSSTETILVIWTEYPPVRRVLESFRALGGRLLVGTSANKNGRPSISDVQTLWSELGAEVDAVLEDSFDHLPMRRRQSTTIVDFTVAPPRLHRPGNVTTSELSYTLGRCDIPALAEDELVLTT